MVQFLGALGSGIGTAAAGVGKAAAGIGQGILSGVKTGVGMTSKAAAPGAAQPSIWNKVGDFIGQTGISQVKQQQHPVVRSIFDRANPPPVPIAQPPTQGQPAKPNQAAIWDLLNQIAGRK